MSFDVFLHRFAQGESVEVDRQPVREVLRAASFQGPDRFGFYRVAFPDGVEVDFSASGLECKESFNGCAFHIRRFGDGLAKFIFDIARAGDMVIIPAMQGAPLVLVSEEQKDNLPDELREDFQPILVRSAGELGALLSRGFEGWSDYRDYAVRRFRTEGEA